MPTYTDQFRDLKTALVRVPAVALGVDAEIAVAVPGVVGTVEVVTYTPDALYTGAATNYRSFQVRNKGQAGAGTTVVAQLDGVAGVNAPAYDEKAITLSGTPANLDVAAGDVLTYYSLHVGTGLADPGGLLKLGIRTA